MQRFTLFTVLLAVLLFFFALTRSTYIEEESSSFSVDLQKFPLYVKQGFDRRDTISPDLDDAAWLKKSPFSNVIISRLDLPGLPKRTFLSPFSLPEREFTFVIPFVLDSLEPITESSPPGLFLACIGDNWEVYLNGTLVRSEMHLKQDSLQILSHRSQRNTFFPFSGTLLREGPNLLAFRLVGDPTNKTLGFQYSRPYYIADYKTIQKDNSETIELIMIGGYLLIAAYHFLLYATHSKDKHNLFCGAFSALMGFYYLSVTHGIYFYIPDTELVVKIEFFCIFLVIPALGAFVETLCSGKIFLVTKLYSAFFAFLAVSQLFLSRPYGSDALMVWQVLAIAVLLYLLTAGILIPFIRDVKARRREDALRGASSPGLAWFFAETYSGNLLIAVGVIVASAVIDIVDSLFFHYSLRLTHYFFYIFVMIVTLMLARIYGKLNLALQAKSAFLANMSHDIRTPLNAIMGTAEQILRNKPDAGVRDKAERIKQAGTILTSIINDVLDLSRLEARRLEIIKGEYRFQALIDEVASMIGPELSNRGIAFTLEIDAAIPPTLVGDAPRIRQILLNLLWNAVKFTRHGNVGLKAAWKNDGPGQPLLVFTVSDTGPGIKPEELSNIFLEFYQLDRRQRGSAEGIGLGLAICRNLCALMGGQISVQSDYGVGSVFTVSLPQQPGAGGIPEELPASATLLERGIILPTARVLIVDDLASNRQVLSGLLEPYAMSLHVARNGQEALTLAAKHAYDLVFMDHLMEEDMDGVAAIQALRQVEGHAATQVVALTANAMKGMREFFLENGFQDYISKPVDPAALDAVIARLMPQEKQRQKAGEHPRLKDLPAFPAPATPVPPLTSGLPSPIRQEMAREQCALLRHFCWHFANGFEADAAYCAKLDALVKSLDGDDRSPHLRRRLAGLSAACERLDFQKIAGNLPEVYAGLMAEQNGGSDETRAAPKPKDELLPPAFVESLVRLQAALEQGDAKGADEAFASLRDMSWPQSLREETRELFFFLYDCLLLEQRERAAGALALWYTIFGHKGG